MIKFLLSAIVVLSLTFQAHSQVWSNTYSTNDNSGSPKDRFGQSVSLSGNGNYAIVGANGSSIGKINEQGKAIVYIKSGTNWAVQDTLVAPDPGMLDGFGYVVDMSDDGTTVIVGAPTNDIDTNQDQGKAYVFSRKGTKWKFQAELTAPDGTKSELFGYSVSLSENGNTAIVGAKNAYGNLGKSYVFTRSDTLWFFQSGLIANDRKAGDSFGDVVKLSADGNLAFVGAGRKTIVASIQQGKVYIYQRSGSTWNPLSTIVSAEPQTYDQFGSFLDISRDGNTVIISSANRNTGTTFNNNRGKVYVFTRTGNNWIKQAEFESHDAEDKDYFGSTVSISHDGNIAFIGSGHKTINNVLHQGKVYVYNRTGNTWSFQEDIMSLEPFAYDYFGAALSLSGDGKTALIASPLRRTENLTPQGKVYFYTGTPVTGYIPSINTDLVAVYPNPAKDFIQIDFNSEMVADLEILNLEGVVVRKETIASGNNIKLNLEGPSGVYYLKIKQMEKTSIFKILKM